MSVISELPTQKQRDLDYIREEEEKEKAEAEERRRKEYEKIIKVVEWVKK